MRCEVLATRCSSTRFVGPDGAIHRPARLASATGFFWTCFSLGIGVFGAYLPSFIMPVFGEYKTFWFALPFSIVGTVMCFFFVPKTKSSNRKD